MLLRPHSRGKFNGGSEPLLLTLEAPKTLLPDEEAVFLRCRFSTVKPARPFILALLNGCASLRSAPLILRSSLVCCANALLMVSSVAVCGDDRFRSPLEL